MLLLPMDHWGIFLLVDLNPFPASAPGCSYLGTTPGPLCICSWELKRCVWLGPPWLPALELVQSSQTPLRLFWVWCYSPHGLQQAEMTFSWQLLKFHLRRLSGCLYVHF